MSEKEEKTQGLKGVCTWEQELKDPHNFLFIFDSSLHQSELVLFLSEDADLFAGSVLGE